MQPILLYYAAGVTAALAVGTVCYYVVGFAATPLWEALFGSQAAPMWGRLFRMSVVTVALVGALATKFYGCGGPTDYDAVARDHRLMAERTSGQVSQSLADTSLYLLLVAAAAAITFAVVRAAGYSRSRSIVCEPAATSRASGEASKSEYLGEDRSGGRSSTVPSSERGAE
jgi:hypothetical protein